MIKRLHHIFLLIVSQLRPAFPVLLLMLASANAGAQYSRSREYNIKAVFLYNFTQFVEWPETAFPTPGSPFVIGIVGDDPFRTAIDAIVTGEKVKEHPIVVQRFATLKEVDNCHIIFVSGPEAESYAKSGSELRNKSILTVSDAPGFAKMGGMIRLVMQENKIKLQINPTVAKAAQLSISSKLLRLAEIVE